MLIGFLPAIPAQRRCMKYRLLRKHGNKLISYSFSDNTVKLPWSEQLDQ